MRCRQVRNAIDRNPLGQLANDSQLAIMAHCEGCAPCRRSLDSAAVARALMKARVSEEVEPSLFFKTRVLAAIRERGAATVRWSPEKMWRSARAIVASMFVIVIVLVALNLLVPRPTVDATSDTARSAYSVERVVIDDNSAAQDEGLTSGQVLDTVFAQGDSYGID